MVRHRRTPGMQYQRQPRACAQVLRVGRDRLYRLGSRPEQDGVDHRLVVVGEIADWRRQREYQVVILDRQQIGLTRFEPTLRGTALASGTMAVTARVVGNLAMIAALAMPYMTTERRAAASLDGRHDLELAETNVSPVHLTPRLAPSTEDIRDLEGLTGHGPLGRY